MKCDFCLVTCSEAWSFQVSQFFEPVGNIHVVEGEWAACDECLPFIQTRDLEGLVDRVSTAIGASLEVDKARRSYAMLLERIESEPERFTDADPFPYAMVCKKGKGFHCGTCGESIEAGTDEEKEFIRRGATPLCEACGAVLVERWVALGHPLDSISNPASGAQVMEIKNAIRREHGR